MHVCLVTQSCLVLWLTRLLCLWDSLRQEYWRGLPLPVSWDLPHPGIEPVSLALASGFFTTSDTSEDQSEHNTF